MSVQVKQSQCGLKHDTQDPCNDMNSLTRQKKSQIPRISTSPQKLVVIIHFRMTVAISQTWPGDHKKEAGRQKKSQ